MRIVVAGAGEFGLNIAQLLLAEEFDIVVVDNNPDKIKAIQGSLDCLLIEENACNGSLFRRPDVANADMFIGCMDDDELNMVACMFAKHHGIKHTVACVRNADYMRYEKEFINNEMKIDLLLNTDYIVAKEIVRILTASSSLNVETFASGKVKMFEARIAEDSPLANKYLRELDLPRDILAALVLHGQNIFVPRGNDILQANDFVYFVGTSDNIANFEKNFNSVFEKPKRVMMIGAGRTGRFTAPLLERCGMLVKAIEKNEERCQLLAGELKKGIVLCGDGTNIDLLAEEGVAESDVVLAVTDDEKLNLMVALVTKHLGAKRTLVRVDHSEFTDLMGKVGVDMVFSTRSLMAAELLRFIHGGDVLNVSVLDDAQSQAVELIVGEGSEADNKAVRDLNLPAGSLLCAVVRGDEAYIPKGDTVLHKGDRLVLLARNDMASDATQKFESRN